MKNGALKVIALIGMALSFSMSSFAMKGPSSDRYNRILQKIREKNVVVTVAPQPVAPEKKVVPQDEVPEGTCALCEDLNADSPFGCGLRLHHACKSCFDKWVAKNRGCPFCVK